MGRARVTTFIWLGLLSLTALAGCQAVEGPTSRGDAVPSSAARPGPSLWSEANRAQSIEQRVFDAEPARPWQWIVESGSVPGGLDDAGTSLPAGLSAGVRADAPSGGGETVSVEEGTPAGLRVGVVAWPRSAGDPTGITPGTEVLIDWLVCVRSRGTCAVEVDAVPRVLGRDGCPKPLESWRVRRTVPLDSALVIGMPSSATPSSSPLGAALVGAQAGHPGRFVIRVKE